MCDKDIQTGYSFWRGHKIIWDGRHWRFEDDNKPIPGYGGDIRACKKCGELFERSNIGDADSCLGELPGVDNACCGHGNPEQAYIRFTNGVVVKGFTCVEKPEQEFKLFCMQKKHKKKESK